MKRTVSALAALLALTALTGCDRFEPRGGKSLDPMPADVPVTPQYTSPDEVVAALERAGIPCEVLRRRTGALDCEAQISGATVENRIQVLNPEEFSRDEVGDSIAAWRNSGTTVVAAGNWFIRVLPNGTPAHSIKIAEAVGAVVLPPPLPPPPTSRAHPLIGPRTRWPTHCTRQAPAPTENGGRHGNCCADHEPRKARPATHPGRTTTPSCSCMTTPRPATTTSGSSSATTTRPPQSSRPRTGPSSSATPPQHARRPTRWEES